MAMVVSWAWPSHFCTRLGDAGGDAEAVAETFRRGVRAVEPGSLHDGVDGTPAGHARPGPEAVAAPFAALGLPLADAVHQVEGVEQGRGHRHGAVDAALPLLQALDHQHAGGEVDAIGGQRQRLGEAAAGIGQGHTQGAHLTISQLGGAEEGVALAGVRYLCAPSAVCSCIPEEGRGAWPGARRHADR
jgi:hypothetical protein